jgi:surface antigen
MNVRAATARWLPVGLAVLLFGSSAVAAKAVGHRHVGIRVNMPLVVNSKAVVQVSGRVLSRRRPSGQPVLQRRGPDGRWILLSRGSFAQTWRAFVIVWRVGPSSAPTHASLSMRVALLRGGRTVAASRAASVAVRGTPRRSAGPADGPSPRAAQAHARAQAQWAQSGSEILSGFHTGAGAGQCTDYAARQRPDIIQRVFEWSWTERLLGNNVNIPSSWAAKDWARNASATCVPVGHTPQVRAAIVFQPGAYGADPAFGHIGIVTAVHSDGSFSIKEMNAGGGVGVVSRRSFAASTARAMAASSRVAFIPD